MQDKKQEIVNIICATHWTPHEQADKILALFSVSLDEQSEATVCGCKEPWPDMGTEPFCVKCDKDMVYVK